MPITIGNGNINVNSGLKTITDVAGKQIKGGIAFDGNNLRISAKENFIRKVSNRSTKGELADLYKNNKRTSSFFFPQDLDDEHYVMINAVKRSKQTISEPKGKKEILTSIVLPVPGNLQVQYQAQYENAQLGQIGAAAAGRLGLRTATRGADDIVGKLSDRISAFGTNDISQTGSEVGAAAATIGATVVGFSAAGILGGVIGAGGIDNVISGTLVNEGIAFNPHMAVMFRGVDFRTHVFEYKFVARNQMESNTIKSIIAHLKHHMLPSNTLGSRQGSVGLAFEYPEEFEISFAPGIRSYLYQIGTSVLTQMTVNYNGENIPIFFEDTQAPVSITMNLSFQETAILTKDGFQTSHEDPIDFDEVVNSNIVTKTDKALTTLGNGHKRPF